jgi:hypothetical protein
MVNPIPSSTPFANSIRQYALWCTRIAPNPPLHTLVTAPNNRGWDAYHPVPTSGLRRRGPLRGREQREDKEGGNDAERDEPRGRAFARARRGIGEAAIPWAQCP